MKCVSVQLVPEHLQIFGLAQPQNDDIILSSFLTNTCFEELEFLNLEKNEALNIEKLNCLANRSCPKLNALKLDLCKNLNLNDEVLEKLIGNCPNLEITSLLKVQVDDLSDELIYKLLAKPIILNSISEEKRRSVQKYIRNNIPLNEHPPDQNHLSQQRMIKVNVTDLEDVDDPFNII